MSTPCLKVVLVGDGQVGKTWLVRSFIDKDLHTDSFTTFDNYTVNLKMNSRLYQLSIWDTAGQEQYDKLRVLSYPQTDVFLLCYAINSISSFNNVMKWYKEVRRYDKKVILVACKQDTRRDMVDSGDAVSEERGRRLADNNDMGFIECSAVDKYNIAEVFKMCVDAVREGEPPRQKWWRKFFCCGC